MYHNTVIYTISVIFVSGTSTEYKTNNIYLHIITWVYILYIYYMIAQHNRLIDLVSHHCTYVMFRRYIGHRRQHNNMFTRLNDI